MEEKAEKYLSEMLVGLEGGIPQVEQSIEQLEAQLTAMLDQKEKMIEAKMDIKEMLGLEEEEEEESTPPPLKLVNIPESE